MEAFFNKYPALTNSKQLFIEAHVKDEEFFHLPIDKISNILCGNVDAVASFLPFYSDEKKTHCLQLPQHDVSSLNNSNVIELEEVMTVDVEPDVIDSFDESLTLDDTNDGNMSSGENKTSVHKDLPDDYEFVKNSLYYSLIDNIEGQIILGTYKNSKTLLESRLKVFIIQKLIAENTVDYRISREKFEEARDLVKELFKTITPSDWYTAHHKNVFGTNVSASGCLVNFYKIYRQDLALAGIIDFSIKQTNTTPSDPVENVTTVDLDPLVDPDRYGFTKVLDTWTNSFENRQDILVVKKNNKTVIKYESYINTFVCLHVPSGLDLLEIDSNLIILKLVTSKAITNSIAEKFQTCFVARWDIVCELLCNFGDVANIGCIKDFRKSQGDNLVKIPNKIRGLFYAAFYLTKTTSVKAKDSGNFTFQREECVDHFIKIIENESLVKDYKLRFKKKLNDLGLPVHPYVIFCGKLDSITKSFVIIDDIHYEARDPIRAVESCLKASVALHFWPVICANVWLYFLLHVYYILPNSSCCFPPCKSTVTVTGFIKKIDSSFNASEP